MPCMTTYLSKSSFLLPLWFIRRHFSQNFDWLTVNFPICTNTGARNVLRRELNLLLPFLLARHVVSNLPRGLSSLSCMQLPVFFWNRCIWKFVIIKNKLMSVSHAVCPVIDNEFRHNIVTATLTILWRNSWSATRQTREKLTSIC